MAGIAPLPLFLYSSYRDKIFPQMASYHVLIVANQKKERQMLQAGIESLGQGIQISAALSGEEALLLLSHGTLDLLVTELHLVGITGQELLHKVRQRYPAVRCIILTSEKDTAAVQEEARAAGASVFINQPVDMAVFLMAVQKQYIPSAEAYSSKNSSTEQATTQDKPPSIPTLSSSLERLRRELDAFTVMLMAESGEVLTRAGVLPPIPDKASFDPAVSALAGACNGLSTSIGKELPQDLVYISGINFDLCMAHAGQSQTLVAITRPDASIQRLEKILRILLAAANALAQDLVNTPLAEVVSTPPTKRQTDELVTGRLGALLSQAPEDQVRSQELDSFWEAAAERAYREGLPRTGALTYDQARKLGLAPEELD
jgi:CheY-like chemotaxis protein